MREVEQSKLSISLRYRQRRQRSYPSRRVSTARELGELGVPSLQLQLQGWNPTEPAIWSNVTVYHELEFPSLQRLQNLYQAGPEITA